MLLIFSVIEYAIVLLIVIEGANAASPAAAVIPSMLSFATHRGDAALMARFAPASHGYIGTIVPREIEQASHGEETRRASS